MVPRIYDKQVRFHSADTTLLLAKAARLTYPHDGVYAAKKPWMACVFGGYPHDGVYAAKKPWMAYRFGVLLLFMLLGFVGVVSGGRPAYRMDLNILTGGEEFNLVYELDEREFTRLQNDPSTAIQPFLLRARKECAEKIGYRREIYGEDNYQMVRISRYSFVIRDLTQERVVLKKN